MTQTRIGSLIEAITNIVIGFAINFTANLLILPLVGFNVTVGQAFDIGIFFTFVSIGRQYVVRRWFNARLHAVAEKIGRKYDQS